MNGDEQIRGFAFPFKIDSRTGGVVTTAGPAKLKENLKHLLMTRIGERLMLREYGGGVTQLHYENINNGLITVARHQIGRAIVRFERRILLQEISIDQHDGELYVRISYIQADQPGIQTLAFPIS